MTAQHHYRLRDEQEKYFSMMKGLMGADRQRNWSESGKTGRLFILFIAQILGCYLANVRKSKLADDFDSIADVLGEMRTQRDSSLLSSAGRLISARHLSLIFQKGAPRNMLSVKPTKASEGAPVKTRLLSRINSRKTFKT